MDLDPFNLERFVQAQEDVHERVLSELRAGRKTSHWMWFVFPQIEGLGLSWMSKKYAISGLEEARAYLAHPLLGARLGACAEAVLAVEGSTASDIFGFPDDMKLHSSMTLFERAAGPGSVFSKVLEKYFHSEGDPETLRRLAGP
jgi:uncharacterized protein (DUF1810 family)